MNIIGSIQYVFGNKNKETNLMIENLNLEQISAVLDALPFEMMFVDENDRIQYGNKLGTRLFRFKKDTIAGKDLRSCHPKKVRPKVEKIQPILKTERQMKQSFGFPA